MRTSWQYFLLASLLSVAYGSLEQQDVRSISSGLSSGRCRGYCRQSINITLSPSELAALKEPNFAQVSYPAVRQQFPLLSNQWSELVSLVNPKVFTALGDTIGCPGCADGGVEWIQVNWTDGMKRVTFESGRAIKGIEALIERLQQMRKEYLSRL